MASVTRKIVENYIEKWKQRGYENDIPDEAPHELESLLLVPSYRIIATAILKNDSSMLGHDYFNKDLYYLLKSIEFGK